MIITKQLTVDLLQREIQDTVDAVQCDANTRAVAVTLKAGSTPWKPPEGFTASVAFKKPDGKSGWYDKLPNGTAACTVAENVVTAILAPEALTVAGKVAAAVVFQNENLDQLATFPFCVAVSENPAAGNVISNEYWNYTNMTQINEAVNAALATLESDKQDFLAKATEALEVVHGAATEDAPAIVCETSGEVIAVSDASDRALRGLTLYGKTTQFTTTGSQLWDEQYVVGGFADNTGITTSQTDRIRSKNAILVTPSTTYYITFKKGYGRFFFYDESMNFLSARSVETEQFATPENCKYMTFYNVNETYIAGDIMLNLGNKPFPYEPYTGGAPSPSPDYPQELESVGASGSVGVTVLGKNLLPFPYSSGGITSNFGITITCNADGGVTFVGTATGDVYYWLKNDFTEATLPAGNYRLSVTGLSNMSIQVEARKDGAYVKTIRVGAGAFTIDYSTYDTLRVFLICNSGKTVNETIYPQIEVGSTTTAYEPYKGQTLTASTPNGLNGIPVSSGGNYTDEAGQQYLANYRDYARGVEESIEALRLDGTEYWSTGFAGGARYFVLNLAKPSRYRDCHMNTHGYAPAYGAADGNLYFAGASLNQLFIYPGTEKYTSVDAWKAQLAQWSAAGTPFTVLYAPVELGQTPIPEEELAAYAALHSNYPNTTVYNDAGAHMALSYVADTKLYIDGKFNELAAALVNNT